MSRRRASAFPPRAALLAITLAAGFAHPAAAADRELRWRRFDVAARLDARGDLHVRETQVMVMSGDWNGGERRFRLGPGQALRFEGLHRITGPGTARPLVRGDLDEIDRYTFADETTLRWRSRRHVDPPYAETELTFVLEYTLTRVLVDAGEGRFQLAHDFAFPDRPGIMERVSARLTLDPAWQAETPEAGSAELTVEASDLPPGRGAVLVVPLRFVGTGPAPKAFVPPPPPEPPPELPPALRLPLVALLAAAILLAAWRWTRDARARGLLDRLPDAVDEAWLAREVFAHPPEVIGAAWDDRVAAPEVSAVLARLQAQGKLTSSTTGGRFLGLGRKVELRLLADRKTLNEYERGLVDGLFFSGDTTDSSALRARYAGTGFDPVGRIEAGVSRQAHALYAREVGGGPAVPGKRALRRLRLAALALVACAVLLGALGFARGEEPAVLLVPTLAGAVLFLFSLFAADRLARAVSGLAALGLFALAPIALWLWLVEALAGGEAPEGLFPAGFLAVAAHAILFCAGLLAVYAAARSRLQPGEVAVRRRLLAARRHLARELERPSPRLRDDTIPYLLALGLGRGLDRWVRVHGPGAADLTHATLGDASAASFSGGGAWTGGGGSFSGGGASGSWAALASVASGVPAPSSDSSGSGSSGSSGGSSSGGGGGGGW